MKRVRYPLLLAFVLLLATSLSGCLDEIEWELPDQDTEHEEDHYDKYHSQNHGHSHDHDHDHEHDHDEDDHDPDYEEDDRLDPADAYEDASPRYHNHVEGEEESRRTISVPEHTHTLRVALIHDSHDEYAFRLYEPHPLEALPILHNTAEVEEKGDGHKYADEPEWVLIHDPTPGEWTLTIDIDGCSKYTVGFYID